MVEAAIGSLDEIDRYLGLDAVTLGSLNRLPLGSELSSKCDQSDASPL